MKRIATLKTSHLPRLQFVCLLLILGLSIIAPQNGLPRRVQPGGTVALAASCHVGQSPVEASVGRGAQAQKPGPVSSSLSATVDDHRTAGEDPPANCVAPTAKSRFAPTDARAYQWTLVSGATAGDVVRWDFRQPNGTSYSLTEPVTITFNGGVCLWAYINISNTPVASLLGNWEVRLLYNGVVVATDAFSIRSDNVILSDHRLTGTEPTSCTPPAIKTTYLSTDPRVYQWTLVSAAVAGDTVRWEFVQPNGSVYATSSTLTLSTGGNNCFWVGLDIAGQPAASLVGTWQVRVIYNNVPLLPTPDTFTISNQVSCPTVSSLNPVSAPVGSGVTITGTNFTGVTSVKFANNVTAGFMIVNSTTLETAVPTNAVTGPITISKSGCSDVNTPPFTVVPRPAIEVSQLNLAFGSVNTGNRASLPLMIRNAGNARLAVGSVTSNNPQFTTSLDIPGFGLDPGQSLKVTVSFAPTSGGPKAATLSINSNDPVRPIVTVPMTGTGLTPVIDVSPVPLAFGDVKLAQAKDLVLTLRNTGTAALKVTSIASSNAQFAPTRFLEKPSNNLLSLPMSIAAGNSVEVTVRFRPAFVPSSVGSQSGVLSIDSNDPTRAHLDVALTGRGLGPLLTSPGSLSFGTVSICSASPVILPLTLTNTGNDQLGLTALSIDNPAFTIVQKPTLPLLLAPGASIQVNVGFATRNVGQQIGHLLVGSNAVNNPGLSVLLSGAGAPIPTPVIGQLSVSRTTLSHGRVDSARPISVFSPVGLADVIGFAFPGGPLQANSIAPGVLPPALIGGFPGLPAAAIPSAPDPLRITLGGGLANPIVVSAANIPSSFTLVVAEGITAPDVTRWDRVGTRFGSGNLYASVAIPGTSIFPGMELVTEADFNAYTANSIIYEAPDFGFVVAPAGQNGGTATLQARARRIPADPACQQVFSQPQTTQVEFSRTVHLEILSDRTVITNLGGVIDVTVAAQIFGNFDPAPNTVVRFAYSGNTADVVVDDPDVTPPGAPRILTHTFRVPITDDCTLSQISVVASSTGNVPLAFLPPINPFLVAAPSSIDLFTFRSGGTTIEDTQAVLVRAPNSSCGGGTPVGWVRGTITNATTGHVIAGATVSVAGTNLVALTGDDGTYELNDVPAGARTLTAAADGFSSMQAPVTVTAGQVLVRDFALQPLTGTIRGFVIDVVTFQGIAGASVTLKGTNISTVSGSDGSYTLSNVPPGAQTITASAPNYSTEEEIVVVVAEQTVPGDIFLIPTIGTITGVVTNAATNQPISGATVSVAGTGLSANTSASGSYTIANVPAGPQTLNASANGFNAGSASGTVLGGQTVTQNFALVPLVGAVSGLVRSPTLDPLPGATVNVVGTGISTSSGADGSYTLGNIPAGPQTISASAAGFRPTQANVTVIGNQTISQDLTLNELTGSVAGKITDATTSAAIANAELELLPFPLSSANTDGAGNYVLTGVPVGQQVLFASAPGYYGKIAVVSVNADQTTNLNLSLTLKVGNVSGTIFDKFRSPVGIATVSVVGTNLAVSTAADGTYDLANVPAGTRTLSVQAGAAGSAQATVNVVAGETVYKDIYLQTPSGTVRGKVTNASNNQPIAGASILVGIPFGAIYYSAFTDGGGNYQLNDIPTGSITVYAGADGYIAGQATGTVVVNQTLTLDLALRPDTQPGTVTGTIKSNLTNQPLPGATITVVGTVLSTTSGPDGTYSLTAVPSGAQTLSASKAGFATASVGVTVQAGQSVTKDITLVRETGIIQGRVTNSATGAGIDGAFVGSFDEPTSTLTTATGSYVLPNAPTGIIQINFSKFGFTPKTRTVTVIKGETTIYDIALDPDVGVITGTVRNAANGNGVASATVTVAGTNLSATSNASGAYTISNVPAGSQTLNVTATGFIATSTQVTVSAGQTVTRDISISPTLPPGELRITLNWNKNGAGHPRDLDAHLVGPNPDGSCFHVYYGNKGSLAAAPFAQLEVDNISLDGAPPLETIRISKLSPGIYRFYVYNYSGEDANGLSASAATVQVFGSSGGAGSFTVPGGNGRYWTVFEINGQTGAVTSVNQLADPSSACH